jgi:hypothetical protein
VVVVAAAVVAMVVAVVAVVAVVRSGKTHQDSSRCIGDP